MSLLSLSIMIFTVWQCRAFVTSYHADHKLSDIIT